MTNLFKKISIIVVVCTALVFSGASVAQAANFTFLAKNQDGTPNRHALLCKGLGCVGTEDYDERMINGSVSLELNPGDVIEVWHNFNYKKNPSYGISTEEGKTWYRFVVDENITIYEATFQNKYLPGGNEIGIDPTENEFIVLLNNHRQSIGLQPLSLAKSLTFTSDSHATYMLNNGTYDHYGLYGWGSEERNTDYGLKVFTEEAIHNGYYNAKDALNSLLNSPSHKDTLETFNATHVGIGRMKDHWVINVSVGCDVDCGAPDFIPVSQYNQNRDNTPPPCGAACDTPPPPPPPCVACNMPPKDNKDKPKNVPGKKGSGNNSSSKKKCKAGISKAQLKRVNRSRLKLVVKTTKCTPKKAKLGVRVSGSKKARYFTIKPGKSRSYTVRTSIRGKVKTTIWLKNGKKDFAKRNVSVKASKSKSSKK